MMGPDLFDEAPLLPWLPDETLFSLCSRLHRLWGHSNSSKTAEILFGRGRWGVHHDLPSALGNFEERTSGAFGSAITIARQRTLLGFYRPFLPEAAVSAAASVMQAGSVSHLKLRLGLLTSRFRANHPLKVCPCCLALDLDRSGWAFWHLEHQFPGVWKCTDHGNRLLTSQVKSNGVERFLWSLPNPDQLVLDGQWTDVQDQAVGRLARFITEVLRLPGSDGWLEPSSVQATIRRRILERGWLTRGGNVRLERAAPAFLAFCRPLLAVAELSGLPSNTKEAWDQVGRIVRPLRSGTHPLRLLTALNWLFDDSEDFIRSHTASGPTEPALVGCSHTSSKLGHELARREELVRLATSGASITAVARQMNIDPSTAMSWAADAGIASRRRPKLLKTDLREVLIAKLRQGADKKTVAADVGISVETVTRVLKTEVGLQALWQAARTENARQRARTSWLKAMGTGGRAVGVKLMRAMTPAAYAWLYRNDRVWLAEHTPRSSPSAPRVSSVRWDERDMTLSTAVRMAILALSLDKPKAGLKLWQIYQAVPELKPKLRSLDRLPLTRRALDEALARPRKVSSCLQLL